MALNSFFSMKKTLFIVSFALFLANVSKAQIVDSTPNNFFTQQEIGYEKPIPYPFIREADIAWSTDLWKNICVEELFNQFFYFPIDEEHNYGKKSLAYILWDAMAANEFPIYEDDELKIPLDNDAFIKQYTKPDTILLEIGYDDDDNEIYEAIIRPKFFEGSEILLYSLRETWFVGRQDTRQDSRRIALAMLKDQNLILPDGKKIEYGISPLFWIPMQHPAVRAVLARYTAYIDQNNIVRQPSWDWVFISQHYHAFITRESNRYNRSIRNYVTGEDAILESALIEEKVFDIEDAMWEY